MSLISRPGYPNDVPEVDEIGTGDLEEAMGLGYQIMLEPASRLLYTQQDGQTHFWGNGDALCISKAFTEKLQALADGQPLLLDAALQQDDILENLAELLNQSILMLLPPADDE